MKSELVDISPTRKELKIEIELTVVRAAYDRISDRYAQMANVPGFRRGHVPRSVIRSRYKSEIRGEVLQELVPEAISNAINEHDLDMIGEPDVHLDKDEALEKFGAEPISVHVHVEVLPTFELGQYKGIELVRQLRPVTEEDLDQVINGLRENSASLLPVEDRGAQLGDTVTVTFNGKYLDEPTADNINVEDVDVELGGPGVQPEFTENLMGVKADDVKNFTVNYPPDFLSKGLAGKRLDYTATVTAVRVKELPEVDDEWAISLGEEFDSLATLRGKLREDLEHRAAVESEHRLRSGVMRQLTAAHPFEVPSQLVEQQAKQRLEQVVRDMVGRGFDPRQSDFNWQSAREEIKVQAEEDIRGSLLLERIAEDEHIEVSDEEIESEIETLSLASRQSKEQVRAALTKEGGERSIAGRLRNRKALDLLIENAQVTDEEWSETSKDEGERLTDEETSG